MLINIPYLDVIGQRYMPGFASTITLDADGEYFSQLVKFLESKEIKYLHYRVTTVTTAGDVEAALCEIDSSLAPAFPNAILGVSNSAYNISTVSSTGWKRVQLSTNYTPAVGDKCFFRTKMVNYVAGNIKVGSSATIHPYDHTTYTLSYLGGAYAADSQVYQACAFEATDGTFLRTSSPPMYSANRAFSSSSTPDEVGNLISLPFKHRIIGAQLSIDVDNACNIVLYNGGTSTISMIANVRNGTQRYPGREFFSTPITINANTSYRLVYKPTTTSNIGIGDSEFPPSYEAACKSSILQGASVSMTSRTDAGAWTDTATAIINISPIIDQIDLSQNNFRGSNTK
jgi:hypothetical protein